MRKLTLFFYVLFHLSQNTAVGQTEGELDPSFAQGGTFISSIGNSYEHLTGLVIQPDQKSVICGQAYIDGQWSSTLMRFNTDGSLDNSFGENGVAHGLEPFASWTGPTGLLAIQEDGKFLAAQMVGPIGNYKLGVTRFNTDGSVDLSFGVNGTASESISVGINQSVTSLCIQDDGQIVVVGAGLSIGDTYSGLFAVRFNTNGEQDIFFNTDGYLFLEIGDSGGYISDVKKQDDGKLVLLANAGFTGSNQDPILLRLNSDGTLDEGFGEAGIVIYNLSNESRYGNALAIDDEGRYIIAGLFTDLGNIDILLMGVLPNGVLDPDFGTEGGYTFTVLGDEADRPQAMIFDQEGRILLAGTHDDFNTYGFVLRYDENGFLDESFGENGHVYHGTSSTYYFEGIAQQLDGKLVVAGWHDTELYSFEFAISRLLYSNPNEIDEIVDINNTLYCYPNPAVDYLYIISSRIPRNRLLEIYDNQGKMLSKLSIPDSESPYLFDLSEYPSGLYSIQVIQDQNAERRIIIIEK